MKILVINCGSSTIKADVFAVENGEPVFEAKALADRVGAGDATILFQSIKKAGSSVPAFGLNLPATIERIIAGFESWGAFKRSEIAAVGHRVVHGGSFSAPALVDDAVVAAIQQMAVFAPLHNPANLAGIQICRKYFPVPQVAVFDTAFHHTLPQHAATYAIPAALTEKRGIRRYGFHGTSHEYVTRECARRMNIRYEDFNAISLHLGNGASACCVRAGKSVDTSMGFTPLEGLVMGTRGGDLDPGILLFLQKSENLSADQIDTLLNKQSGLFGISGNADMRHITERAANGDAAAQLAIEIFCLRARKYLCAYLAWGKPHAVIFTGGIGENAAKIREKIAANLEHLGLILSVQKNTQPATDGLISDESPVALYVVRTDEEKMIASAALSLMHAQA
ncbi:MAG: acetate kinase [Spirochaetes bacterium]|nr:acetate kinase [Spirochaetota bacterium]